MFHTHHTMCRWVALSPNSLIWIVPSRAAPKIMPCERGGSCAHLALTQGGRGGEGGVLGEEMLPLNNLSIPSLMKPFEHRITQEGFKMDDHKVKAILDWEPPMNKA